MKLTSIVATIGAALLVIGCDQSDDRSLLPTPAEPGPDAQSTNAQIEYQRANERMHKGMGVIDSDPDIAFMQGMVPHHQGAVDMAEIVLKYGKDPEARALAETIIASQVKEITQMKAWLKRRGVSTKQPAAVDHSTMDH